MDNTNRSVLTEQTPDWPDLLSKTVNDASSFARSELELFENKLRLLIEAQTEKIAGMLIFVVALSYGSLFLFGGLALLLHLWLSWWLSFLITGAVVVILGISFRMKMLVVARKKEA